MYTFTERSKQTEVQKFLRRLADRSVAERHSIEQERRDESRIGQAIPVYMARWDGECFSKEEETIGLSQNVSSQGIAVVVIGPFQATRLILAFCMESRPHFALGEVRSETPVGGGYRRLGIEMTQLLEVADHPCLERLLPLVARLAPTLPAKLANGE